MITIGLLTNNLIIVMNNYDIISCKNIINKPT